MIIESGIDVIQVLCGSVSNDDPRGLWVVAMDESLRLLFVEPVVAQLVGGVEQYIDDIDAFLADQNEVQYFALAWSTDVERERESGWLRDLDAQLRELLTLGGRRFLGQVVFDPHTMFASVPSCDFSLEPDLADLPRAMAIAGPHGLDCRCPPCSADRREYEAGYDYEDEYGASDRWYGDAPSDYAWPPVYDGGHRGRPLTRSGRRPRLTAHGSTDAFDPTAMFDDEAGRYLEPQYDPVWKRWYPDPERAYKRWTFDEEVAIARSHFAGLSCFDISLLVKRQPKAIASRLNKLGISSSTLVVEQSDMGEKAPLAGTPTTAELALPPLPEPPVAGPPLPDPPQPEATLPEPPRPEAPPPGR
jgi:hypothetical protein